MQEQLQERITHITLTAFIFSSSLAQRQKIKKCEDKKKKKRETRTQTIETWNYLNKEAQTIRCECIPSPFFKVQRYIQSYHV